MKLNINIRIMMIASGDLWAGAEGMIYQLALGLSEIQGLDIFVILLNRNRLALELEKSKISVKVLDESTNSFFSILTAIKKLVTEFSPDIIHSHRYKENLLAWLASIGRPKTKLVATQHGMPEISEVKQDIKTGLRTSFIFRLLSCCFDRTVLVSEEMWQELKGSYGFSDKSMVVIHNGVAIPTVIDKQDRPRLVVGSAGRLFPVKNFNLFIDIARQVVAQNDKIDFIIAGDGPLRFELEEKINRYGIQDRCYLAGHQENMEAFYKNIDLYINTSLHEGIPMSILEAMVYGLPVVVPKVGGFPEIVQSNIQGFLIEGRNQNDYIERLLQLIDDKHLRTKMSKAARKRVVDCFSRTVMVRKYYNLYHELMGGV